uniref:G-protein coupled receptors family 1 profile domain-containing protein n=1 Tax=Anopheles culicifacies TaxID=139723 RepID=A0A182M4R3_9DIPT
MQTTGKAFKNEKFAPPVPIAVLCSVRLVCRSSASSVHPGSSSSVRVLARMTEGPFVYGIELRDPPTAPTDISQYDLLFGPGSVLQRRQHHPNSMGDYGDHRYGANLSQALSDILRENISATVLGTANLTGDFGSTAVSLPPGTGHHAGSGGRGGDSSFQNQLIIPLYAIIFLLSVVGNLLVILTLAQNKRMRTVTNVYLLNLVGVGLPSTGCTRPLTASNIPTHQILAISDLLLGVFCMPFTLAGQVLRRFVFGSVMCKLIPYFQEWKRLRGREQESGK